ncbi:unnamed protein product [marine sediment metagenome]|uniref:Uncharacterized protein n=1 Tax=marine sediment metagenome TaxID=412755 RepID=X1HF23_9ZZZZ
MSLTKKDLERKIQELEIRKNQLTKLVNDTTTHLTKINQEFFMVIGSITTMRNLMGEILTKEGADKKNIPPKPKKPTPKKK